MTTLVLSYGGVSCYVIVFVIYPIALNMFKKADLPRHLIPAVVAAGSFTAVNLGPGSPSVVNNIPVKYLGNFRNGSSRIFRSNRSLLLPAGYVLLHVAGESSAEKGEHFSADEETLQMMAEYEKKEHGNGAIASFPWLW